MKRFARIAGALAVAAGVVAVSLVVVRTRWIEPGSGSGPAPESASSGGGGAPVEAASDDGYCEHAKLPSAACRPAWPVIRLKGGETAARIGLEFARAIGSRHVEHLDANAEVAYAAPSYAEVRPRVAGRVASVAASVGDRVEKGATLVVIDAADVAVAKGNYLVARPVLDLARANADRQLPLVRSGTIAERVGVEVRSELVRAQAALMSAEQRLRNLGYGDDDLAGIVRDQDTSSLLKVSAPLSGTIVERTAVVGQAVEASTILFDVAERSTMWAWIDLYEADVDRVRPGQNLTFTISGTDAPKFPGRVELVGFAVNPTTRTVRVRASLANPDGRLRANQFGQASIELTDAHDAVLVPRSAVQSDGLASVVFLPLDDRRFLPRRVETRPAEESGMIEIPWGLTADQRVVTTGAFLLKSELFKDQIPAED